MKKRVIKIHPELKSAINTFFAGFLPIFIGQIQHIDATVVSYSAMLGIIAVAFRVAFKYGIAELFKWIVAKLSNIEIK